MITLRDDETIKKVVRRHWFILLGRTFGLLIILAAPFVLYGFTYGREIALGLTSFTISVEPTLLVFFGALWALIIWLRFFHTWTDHYLDGWIVTDKRIIDIEQFGFFSRQVSSFRMERIQDITIDIHGIIPTLLDFGDIHVQTAGDSQEFVLKGAPNPKRLKELILKESDKYVDMNKKAKFGI